MPTDPTPLSANHYAVITGASGGIGSAIALRLASHGVHICLIGRREAALESVAAQCQALGVQARCYAADLADEEATRHLVAQIQNQYATVAMLVHCAGAFARGPIASAPVEDFDRLYRVNLRAPYLLTQGLLPQLMASGGQVVFINSSAGLSGRADVSQYASTKHGLKGLADSLRNEVNRYGVRVLSIYPGRTASPMQHHIHNLEARLYQPEELLQAQDIADLVVGSFALPRSAELTDVHIRPARKFVERQHHDVARPERDGVFSETFEP